MVKYRGGPGLVYREENQELASKKLTGIFRWILGHLTLQASSELEVSIWDSLAHEHDWKP